MYFESMREIDYTGVLFILLLCIFREHPFIRFTAYELKNSVHSASDDIYSAVTASSDYYWSYSLCGCCRYCGNC